MSEITVEELRAKVDSWYAKRGEIDGLKDQLEARNKELFGLQSELFAMMEELGLKKFDGDKGKVQMVEIDYVNMPADETQKVEFFEYLKSTGQFDDMITVNYQKLNSWHKAMREEHGEFFQAPGLEQSKTRKELRKGR